MNSVLDFHAIDFKKEVSNYGNSLNELEKAEARAVFTKCLNKGRSFEWIYFAI